MKMEKSVGMNIVESVLLDMKSTDVHVACRD